MHFGSFWDATKLGEQQQQISTDDCIRTSIPPQQEHLKDRSCVSNFSEHQPTVVGLGCTPGERVPSQGMGDPAWLTEAWATSKEKEQTYLNGMMPSPSPNLQRHALWLWWGYYFECIVRMSKGTRAKHFAWFGAYDWTVAAIVCVCASVLCKPNKIHSCSLPKQTLVCMHIWMNERMNKLMTEWLNGCM